MEYYRNLLPDGGSGIYEAILLGIRERAEMIRIPLTPCARVSLIFRAVLADHPELPWASGKWQGRPNATEEVLPIYCMTDRECAAFRESLARVESLGEKLRGLPWIGRERIIFDFFRHSISYDPSAPHFQNAYGALTERRAVCRGLSKGFQLLSEAAGVPAICVEGTLDGKSLHVWNIVLTEQGNYHVDVSMGYPLFAFLYERKNIPYDQYNAFCVSDETLRKTHSWEPGAVPLKCGKDAEKVNGGE